MHLSIKAIARSSSSFHPTVDAFDGGLSIEGNEPFLFLKVPQIKAEAETPISIDQDAPIVNMDSFINYTKTTMASETFYVNLDGKTKVHQKGLQAISVNYNKKIKMQGKPAPITLRTQ